MKITEALLTVREKIAEQSATTVLERWYSESALITFLIRPNVLDGYEYCGRGRHRAVYSKPKSKYVLKIPYNPGGCEANRNEARFFQEGKHEGSNRMARCRLIVISDVPCVLMEKIELNPPCEFPSWSDFVDCQQVGRSREGLMVAYDYGDSKP